MNLHVSNPVILCAVVILACFLLPVQARPPRTDGVDKGRPPNHHGPPPPPSPRSCIEDARRFSKMSLMGGWRKVDLSKSSNLKDVPMDLVKAAVVGDLLKHQLEKPEAGSRPRLPHVDLTSMTITPSEVYTQVVAGIKTCAVVKVASPCDEGVCKEPEIQCVAEVLDVPWLARGEPSASVQHIQCGPIDSPLSPDGPRGPPPQDGPGYQNLAGHRPPPPPQKQGRE